MRLLRLGIIVATTATIAATAAIAGAAAAAGGPAGVPPRAQLAQFACAHALDPPDRSVSVQTVMRPVVGTQRFAVKFELLERVAGSAQTMVRAGDLGVWVAPANATLGQLPGDVWRLNKTVLNLDAPATYQFRVVFRWIGVHGRVLDTEVHVSRGCRERELRPDLAVTSLNVSPVTGHADEALYTAVVSDHGLTGAGPFEVLFVPGGSATPVTQEISFLGSGRSQTVSFTGPVCDPADPPTVTADAAHQVDDYNRANNTAKAVCPAAAQP
jgi:hypothetical protein